jgi:hypothetical protein
MSKYFLLGVDFSANATPYQGVFGATQSSYQQARRPRVQAEIPYPPSSNNNNKSLIPAFYTACCARMFSYNKK